VLTVGQRLEETDKVDFITSDPHGPNGGSWYLVASQAGVHTLHSGTSGGCVCPLHVTAATMICGERSEVKINFCPHLSYVLVEDQSVGLVDVRMFAIGHETRHI
jgi:hypothetical protein